MYPFEPSPSEDPNHWREKIQRSQERHRDLEQAIKWLRLRVSYLEMDAADK